MSTRVLITGGGGFIGAWITRSLLKRGASVAFLDLDRNDRVLNQILTQDESARVQRFSGDVVDGSMVKRAVSEVKPTHIIHLAGVQVPICRADPVKGAMVNVVGTLNVFEAAKSVGGVQKIVSASSAAACGLQSDYGEWCRDDDKHQPRTHYGVFKLANEGNARVYWQDHGISSVCLRPHTVYGVGREFGMTSGPTKAIKAAILGVPYTIQFNGFTNFNYVKDLAEIFIGCAMTPETGAHRFNIRGEVMHAKEFLELVKSEVPEAANANDIALVPTPTDLPICFRFDDAGLSTYLRGAGGVPHTPVKQAIPQIADHFRMLMKEGRLDDVDLKA